MEIPEGYTETAGGLWCLPGYLSLTGAAKAAICNGIGAASGLTKSLPDTVWGLDCREAGDIHDHCYWVGGGVHGRRVADMVFRRNLLFLFDLEYSRRQAAIKGACAAKRGPLSLLNAVLLKARRARARKYYLALRAGGWAHYRYTRESMRLTDMGASADGE